MGTLYNRNNCTRHFLMGVVVFALSFFANGTSAQSSNQNRLMLGCGALYERGFDATVAYEHETKYHHALEYFATGYLKYRDDPAAGHVTEKSFWDSYNTWHVGIAYKPCVSRGRNHHGNARLGVSGATAGSCSSR